MYFKPFSITIEFLKVGYWVFLGKHMRKIVTRNKPTFYIPKRDQISHNVYKFISLVTSKKKELVRIDYYDRAFRITIRHKSCHITYNFQNKICCNFVNVFRQ